MEMFPAGNEKDGRMMLVGFNEGTGIVGIGVESVERTLLVEEPTGDERLPIGIESVGKMLLVGFTEGRRIDVEMFAVG